MRQVNDVTIPHTYGIYKYLDGVIRNTVTNQIIPEVNGNFSEIHFWMAMK